MSERSSTDDVVLAAECSAFCVYLAGHEPSEYIRRRYCEAHKRTDLIQQDRSNGFDLFIIRFARCGSLCARLADVYTRWFYRRSALRRKLLLLLAILECSRSTCGLFEAAHSHSKVRFWLWMAYKGATLGVWLITSFLFFSCCYPLVKYVVKPGKNVQTEEQWAKS